MKPIRVAAKRRFAFTLIELLLVIAIIGVLAAVLFPVFLRSREKARASSCLSNYHQMGIAIHLYAQDFDDNTPPNGGSFDGLIRDCKPYIHTTAIFTCPDDFDRDEENRSGSYRMASLYQGLPIACNWEDPYRPGQIAQPSTTTLLYEAEKDFAQSPILPTYRHGSGTQVLYFDGHARWVAK